MYNYRIHFLTIPAVYEQKDIIKHKIFFAIQALIVSDELEGIKAENECWQQTNIWNFMGSD